MRKFLLLFISVAVAMSASAGIKSAGNAYRPMGKTAPSGAMKAPAHVDIITEQPEGTVVDYARSGSMLTVSFYGYEPAEQVGRVKVVYAEDGQTVYIKDPLNYGEGVGAWVQGTLNEDGTIISVPLGQYVSYNVDYSYGLILAWGSTDVIDLGEDFYWVDFYADETVDAVNYAVDPESGTITMMGSEGDVTQPYPYNCAATGLAGVWDDDGSFATIEWGSTWTKMSEPFPAVPANPEAIEFFDSGREDGYTRFDFNINLDDVDGNPMHTDFISYSIYTDYDEVFTFDCDTYGEGNGLEADMTEVPYGFYGNDFYLRRVYFYRTNKNDNPFFSWRIGIQVHYTVNGVRNSSDIVYLEVYPKPTAVNELDGDKQVSNVRYYNMAGQQVAQPSGMTIQVTTYSDGTTSAAKVVK